MTIPSDPYYSIDPSDLDRYHVFADCPNGVQILPQHRRNGTNDSPLCGSCEDMQSKPSGAEDKSEALPTG